MAQIDPEMTVQNRGEGPRIGVGRTAEVYA
jgi:hypothetical protein